MHINSIKPIQFLGQRDGVAFRKEARSLIKELENIRAGSWEYWGQTKEGEDTVQERLAKAVFIMPEKIGAEYITKVDRSLHERLKVLYKLYEEAEDMASAAAGSGGHYIDRTVNYTI